MQGRSLNLFCTRTNFSCVKIMLSSLVPTEVLRVQVERTCHRNAYTLHQPRTRRAGETAQRTERMRGTCAAKLCIHSTWVHAWFRVCKIRLYLLRRKCIILHCLCFHVLAGSDSVRTALHINVSYHAGLCVCMLDCCHALVSRNRCKTCTTMIHDASVSI